MGLASSQARLLLLVARKSDLEYRGQCINQRRLVLSFHTEELARQYSNGLSDRRLYAHIGDDVTRLSVADIMAAQKGMGFLVFSRDGQIVGATGSGDNWTAITNPNTAGYVSDDLLETGLRTGGFYLVDPSKAILDDASSINVGKKWHELTGDERKAALQTGSVDWRTLALIEDKLYDENDESISADYEYETALIHSEDQRLEVELRNVDTQHKAVETEIEAVKKVIDKNIEMSFKTFA